MTKKSLDFLEIREEKKNSPLRQLFSKMKSTSSKSVAKNFEEVNIANRLTTFETFGFSGIEKDSNKGLNEILCDTKLKKETNGMMSMTDLWSDKMRTEVAKRANFKNEKRIIEKLGILRTKASKSGKKPEFKILSKKSEDVYKNRLTMKEASKAHEEKKLELNHGNVIKQKIFLRGKTFHLSRG